jgi:hypothetical protein
MPVTATVSSDAANETLRAPISPRTVRLTSSLRVACTRHAAYFRSPVLLATRMQLTEIRGE